MTLVLTGYRLIFPGSKGLSILENDAVSLKAGSSQRSWLRQQREIRAPDNVAGQRCGSCCGCRLSALYSRSRLYLWRTTGQSPSIETHLRPTAAVSRKDRRPNSGYSKPSRCRHFLLRCLLSDQAFTGLPRSAARRAEGPGIRAAGYQQSAGFALQPTFQSNVALTHAAQRSSARLLSGLLVTVLQLRVTGYRKAPGGN